MSRRLLLDWVSGAEFSLTCKYSFLASRRLSLFRAGLYVFVSTEPFSQFSFRSNFETRYECARETFAIADNLGLNCTCSSFENTIVKE